MLREFTISFWIYPTDFQTYSVVLNAFDRLSVEVQESDNSVSVKFKTGLASYVEPIYDTAKNKVERNKWNYVSAS